MKRIISFLLAILLVAPFVTFYVPSADALGAVWVKEFYTDKFGDKTEQFYLTNKSQFKGTYNSDSVSKGKLGAKLIFERDSENLIAYIALFMNGKDQLKNGTSSGKSYEISVKRADGSQFTTQGDMPAGKDRITISNRNDLSESLLSGDVDLYIEERNNTNNNFLFKVKRGNFKDLFNNEILVLYQEEKYQEAEELLKNKQFAAAIEAFAALGEYSDSKTKIDAVKETAYVEAENLIASERFDEAYALYMFLAEMNFKDSVTKLDDIKKIMFSRAKIGSHILFGKYENDNNTANGKENIVWLVLAKEEDKILVISKYALDVHAYDTRGDRSLTWETCSIRRWLNGAFLNEAFSKEEQDMIPSVTVFADANPDYNTNPGNSTEDQVFLLSAWEVNNYFSSATARKCTPTDYAVTQGKQITDAYMDDGGSTCWWWLRSPGEYSFDAMTVSSDGTIRTKGSPASLELGAVRPAIWINLKTDIF